MGNSDYSVDALSVQQLNFLGQKIDLRNRVNVEICLLLETNLSVSVEKLTVANGQNDIKMNWYVNLVCNFCVEDFVELKIHKDMAVHLFNANNYDQHAPMGEVCFVEEGGAYFVHTQTVNKKVKHP